MTARYTGVEIADSVIANNRNVLAGGAMGRLVMTVRDSITRRERTPPAPDDPTLTDGVAIVRADFGRVRRSFQHWISNGDLGYVLRKATQFRC